MIKVLVGWVLGLLTVVVALVVAVCRHLGIRL